MWRTENSKPQYWCYVKYNMATTKKQFEEDKIKKLVTVK